jgi:hypothetical protein
MGFRLYARRKGEGSFRPLLDRPVRKGRALIGEMDYAPYEFAVTELDPEAGEGPPSVPAVFEPSVGGQDRPRVEIKHLPGGIELSWGLLPYASGYLIEVTDGAGTSRLNGGKPLKEGRFSLPQPQPGVQPEYSVIPILMDGAEGLPSDPVRLAP